METAKNRSVKSVASECSTKCRSRLRRQRDTGETFQRRKGLPGDANLDGGHAHGAGRFEITTEVVEKNGCAGRYLQLPARKRVDPGLGFAHPNPERFHEAIKFSS